MPIDPAHYPDSLSYEKFMSDPVMEAFRDRTIKIDIPFLLEWIDLSVFITVYEEIAKELGKPVIPFSYYLSALAERFNQTPDKIKEHLLARFNNDLVALQDRIIFDEEPTPDIIITNDQINRRQPQWDYD